MGNRCDFKCCYSSEILIHTLPLDSAPPFDITAYTDLVSFQPQTFCKQQV